MGRKSREKRERRSGLRPPRQVRGVLPTGTLQTPRFGLAEIRALLAEATAFLGEETVRTQIGGMRRGDVVFPWTPGLRWWLQARDDPGALLPDELQLDVGVVVRDIHYLMNLQSVRSSPSMREAARQRLLQEPDSALWEMRSAGTYAASGISVEWAALTKADQPQAPDVELPVEGIHIEVKSRRRKTDPMGNANQILAIIEGAGRALGGSRPGILIMTARVPNRSLLARSTMVGWV